MFCLKNLARKGLMLPLLGVRRAWMSSFAPSTRTRVVPSTQPWWTSSLVTVACRQVRGNCLCLYSCHCWCWFKSLRPGYKGLYHNCVLWSKFDAMLALHFSLGFIHDGLSDSKSVLFQVMVWCWLTHWPLGDLNVILKMWSSILLYWLVSSNLLMIISSGKCHKTLLMISQHWFR